jgi:hypothetical protein
MTATALSARITTQSSPLLHADGAAAWDISDEVLAFIHSHVRPGMQTLETGAGQSTLAFLTAGAVHTAVTPSQSEADAIRRAALERELDTDRLAFAFGYSQDVLPGLMAERSTSLDVVLIDGGHGFPIPTVDWVYTAPKLKLGGLMIVDDVDLWTGQMLVDFMRAEACWKHQTTLRGRTAVFRLVAPFQLREWTNQPFVVGKSRLPQAMRKARNLIGLLMKGDFAAIRRKAANEARLAQAARSDY